MAYAIRAFSFARVRSLPAGHRTPCRRRTGSTREQSALPSSRTPAHPMRQLTVTTAPDCTSPPTPPTPSSQLSSRASRGHTLPPLPRWAQGGGGTICGGCACRGGGAKSGAGRGPVTNVKEGRRSQALVGVIRRDLIHGRPCSSNVRVRHTGSIHYPLGQADSGPGGVGRGGDS